MTSATKITYVTPQTLSSSPNVKMQDVIFLQQLLNNSLYPQYLSKRLNLDGYFGTGTQNAVKTFQGIYGLPNDGVVGPETWYKLQVYASL